MKKVISERLMNKFWKEVGTFYSFSEPQSLKLQQKITLLTYSNFTSLLAV